MGETRKLAAILVSDVVGYSRLAGADEDRILARLRTLRSDLIDPTIAVHHGRIVKRTGDGSIIEFRSVVDAVNYAIEVQRAMVERNAEVAPERRIEFRIGIHLGDVVEESDGDLMGDGVNIASRLEGIAKPGAICLSEQAYWQVKGRLEMAVSDLGATQLKNIAEPVRVYSLEVGARPEAKLLADQAKQTAFTRRWAAATFAAAIAALLLLAAAGGWFVLAGHSVKPAQAAHLSIVVLPFANLSGDPSQDYFAEGVTENLTTELSRIRDSFVIARNTAFTFKGKSIDAKEIGKELGVRYVLEGSVQRDQNRVRVNAQLIDAETGAHVWADRFEADIADLFKLQDDVVARLGNSIGNELVKAEARSGARKVNPDIIDITMRGRYSILLFYRQQTKENLYAARALFEQALAIDPDDADALAGDAWTYMIEFTYGWTNSATDYGVKILAQADRSIAVAPNVPDAYAAKGIYLAATHRADEAVKVMDAGLAVNPNSALVYGTRAVAEAYLFRYEQMISDARQAMQLSPLDPEVGIWHWLLGFAELGLGRFDAAVEEDHEAVNAGFVSFLPYRDMAAAFAMQGKMDEARSAVAEARRINPQLTMKLVIETAPNVPALLEGLRKAGLPEE